MIETGVVITWLGHSCFALEEKGYRIILDPYLDGTIPGYKPLRVEADAVYCSHKHADHGGENQGQEVVRQRQGTEKKNPWTVTEIHSFHDQKKGKERGENIIRIFDDGKYRIAHMGDIGCELEADQMELLKKLGVCLVPVGGFFTLPPERIKAIMDDLSPRLVVPMHYRFGLHGYPMIGTLSKYLKLVKESDVGKTEGRSIHLPEDLKMKIAELTYEGNALED
jgi:L-ascorbate metabolism protein UlaG (beta-lactamase superfamily)